MTESIDYEKYLLKDYKYWTIYLHYNQVYLGRSYIALKRSGNLDPYIDILYEEKTELEIIIADLQKALDKLYKPDLYNYANFRNTWHRCHWHVIPRYENPRIIDGQKFLDKNWGKNYAPYDRNFEISQELFIKIQHSISTELTN